MNQKKMKKTILIILFSCLFSIFHAPAAFSQVSVPANGGWSGLAEFAAYQKNIAAAKAKKEQFAAALKVFPAALTLVTGETLFPLYLEGLIAAFAMDEKYKSVYDQGVKLSDAVKWLKEGLANKESKNWRLNLLNNVFQDVHGRNANAGEQILLGSLLMEQKATYTSLALEQRQKLRADKTLRAEMINRAYQKAMGRNAKTEDLNYWQPRPEDFSEIIAAARAYLYSPNGRQDLREMIARAYAEKKKPSPSEESIKWTIDHFDDYKQIYAEMLADKFYSWQ